MIPKIIVVHHSASAINATIGQLDEEHKNRGFTLSSLGFYIGYHYVIDWSGKVTQTRKPTEMGCHCIPNDGKVGICLIGNFMGYDPSNEQLNTLEALLTTLRTDYSIGISNVKGHRELSQTLCPGDHLFFWLNLYRQRESLWARIKALLTKFK